MRKRLQQALGGLAALIPQVGGFIIHLSHRAVAIVLGSKVQTGLVVVNVFFLSRSLTHLRRAKFAASVRVVRDLTKTGRREDLELILENVPPWISFPEWERAESLQTFLSLLWPALNTQLCKLLKHQIEERLQEHTDFGHVTFTRISFGRQPPNIVGTKAVPLTGEDLLAMVLDLDVRWAGEPDIVIKLSKMGGVTIALYGVQIAGLLRVVVPKFLDEPPFFTRLSLSLLKKPYVDFNIRALGGPDLMSLPAVSTWLHTAVLGLAGHTIVLPKQVIIDWGRKHRQGDDTRTAAEDESLAPVIPPPLGLLYIEVETADIQRRRSTFLGRWKTSNPRIALVLPPVSHGASAAGVMQAGLTPPRVQTLKPEWSQRFVFAITSPQQVLRLLLSHQRMDFLGADMPLGCAEVAMEDVINEAAAVVMRDVAGTSSMTATMTAVVTPVPVVNNANGAGPSTLVTATAALTPHTNNGGGDGNDVDASRRHQRYSGLTLATTPNGTVVDTAIPLQTGTGGFMTPATTPYSPFVSEAASPFVSLASMRRNSSVTPSTTPARMLSRLETGFESASSGGSAASSSSVQLSRLLSAAGEHGNARSHSGNDDDDDDHDVDSWVSESSGSIDEWSSPDLSSRKLKNRVINDSEGSVGDTNEGGLRPAALVFADNRIDSNGVDTVAESNRVAEQQQPRLMRRVSSVQFQDAVETIPNTPYSSDNENNDNTNNDDGDDDDNISVYSSTGSPTIRGNEIMSHVVSSGSKPHWLKGEGVWLDVPNTTSVTLAGMLSGAVQQTTRQSQEFETSTDGGGGWLHSLQQLLGAADEDFEEWGDTTTPEEILAGKVLLKLGWTAVSSRPQRIASPARKKERPTKRRGRQVSEEPPPTTDVPSTNAAAANEQQQQPQNPVEQQQQLKSAESGSPRKKGGDKKNNKRGKKAGKGEEAAQQPADPIATTTTLPVPASLPTVPAPQPGILAVRVAHTTLDYGQQLSNPVLAVGVVPKRDDAPVIGSGNMHNTSMSVLNVPNRHRVLSMDCSAGARPGLLHWGQVFYVPVDDAGSGARALIELGDATSGLKLSSYGVPLYCLDSCESFEANVAVEASAYIPLRDVMALGTLRATWRLREGKGLEAERLDVGRIVVTAQWFPAVGNKITA